MNQDKTEKLFTGPAHTREPTVFSPARGLDPKFLKRAEIAAWNARVVIDKQKKKKAKVWP